MRPILELIRLEENDTFGTFGVLKIQKQVFCVTLEPPDVENALNRSSIPAQQYRCERVTSPRFGGTYQVVGVPGRTNILFHAGNRAQDTEGCIILAEHFGKLQGDRAVLNSGLTFSRFIALLADYDELLLTVREVF